MPPEHHETQPSAEIVRVEGAKCRRECDLSRSRATLRFGPVRRRNPVCGDRACRGREMQARVRFVPVAGNPLRRSCVSRARNAGESAICPGPATTLCGDRACRGREMQARVRFGFVRRQPSAEIVRVEMRETQARVRFATLGPGPACVLDLATLCGDRACRGREMREPCRCMRVRATLHAEQSVRRNPLPGVSGDWNWRLCSATLVRGAICGAGS